MRFRVSVSDHVGELFEGGIILDDDTEDDDDDDDANCNARCAMADWACHEA